MTPFLLSPLIEDTGDFLQLYTRQLNKPFDRIRLTTTDRAGFATNLEIEFLTLPRLHQIPDEEVAAWVEWARSGIVPIEPEQYTAEDGVSLVHRRYSGVLVHPPERREWKLMGHETRMEVAYGLVRGAYDGGYSDGVEFVVELVEPGERPREIYRRWRDPLNAPGDRGLHRVALDLPSFKPESRLILRTEAGPAGNDRWDWAYYAGLVIE